MRKRTAASSILLGTLVGAAGIDWALSDQLSAISPTTPEAFSLIEGRCPTFSWGGTAEGDSFELVVYALPPETISAGE